jgi:PAS domain-containing protein
MATADSKAIPPVPGGPWPEPRLRALQVEEIYRFAPTAAAFSFFGALLCFAVLVDTGDARRGAYWFVLATAVAAFRFAITIAYRRRARGSDPRLWARLVVGANFLAGVQWGLLGTWLFPDTPGYRQLFTVMIITCFVGGSIAAYAAVKGAHEALSLPATVPTALYLFFIQQGVLLYAGIAALFFCFAIVHYARQLHRNLEERFRLQIERDDLVAAMRSLNEKLVIENRDLAHRVAVRTVSAGDLREREARLDALFEHSGLAQLECDAATRVVACNRAAERLFERRRNDIVGHELRFLVSVPAGTLDVLASADRAFCVEVAVRQGKGTLHCPASFTPLPEQGGRGHGFGVILMSAPLAIAEGQAVPDMK